MSSNWDDKYGMPHPPGQTWIPATESYNFSLYSKHAAAVTLVLFRENDLVNPCYTLELDHLVNKTGRVWHCRVPRRETNGAKYYAYRVAGPSTGEVPMWHAFDSQKLACDPFARDVFFPPGFSTMAAISPGDNSGRAPLGTLLERTRPVTRPLEEGFWHSSDMVIYEMHVKGFTASESSGFSAGKRGTYAGVIEKIPYLQDLGVTAVELMPVFQFNPEESDYWGYNPLFFFEPHNCYGMNPENAEAVEAEFQQMVEALHAAGMEVILDVVYNHTGEGNERGPKFSLKLVDQSTYYMMIPDTPFHQNHSGTGNTLHCANPAVRNLVIDSMRYWVERMGVDGFRFDLAAILSRDSDGSINWSDPPLLTQISTDPVLRDTILIAEPWDIGTYQLGRAFRGIRWSQWNGKYRDTIQRYVRGDAGTIGEMAGGVYGSADLFPDTVFYARHPWQSINYFGSHDGFSLYDLVSYDHKNNWANGEGNRDGHDDRSWNCGHEGDTGVPQEVMSLRRKQMKNFILLLMVSNGIPMIRMGDEFAQTQGGNNNPWNQDNETSWLDWGRLREFTDIHRFMKEMIAFRKRHPSICRHRFWREDVFWHGVSGGMPDWGAEARAFAMRLEGAAENDTDLYLMSNAYWEDLTFTIAAPGQWRVFADTAKASPEDLFPEEAGPVAEGGEYVVKARSTVLLVKG